MTALQKLVSLAVASVVVFSLAGCGDKEETKTFNANLNGFFRISPSLTPIKVTKF